MGGEGVRLPPLQGDGAVSGERHAEGSDPAQDGWEVLGQGQLLADSTQKDPFGRDLVEDLLWSFHTWSPKENPAPQCQRAWRDGLIKKKAKKWADDHPAWLREYMGQWTAGGEGLVYRYSMNAPTVAVEGMTIAGK